MVVCVGLLLSICLYSNCQKTRMSYSYNILYVEKEYRV